MEAIILAGGFGTRLKHVVKDVPKPMAPVCGKPFLWYILKDLKAKGIEHIVLAVGYKKECIREYFGTSFQGVKLDYSEENTPLFTGGAIKQALALCREEQVFVINGDTFFDVDLERMKGRHIQNGAVLTIATKYMTDFERYGTIATDSSERIVGFLEKQHCEQGRINGGVYLLRRDALEKMDMRAFSFEKEYMEKRVSEGGMYAYPSDGYFIDIGIPEDYAKAQEDFLNHA